LQLAPLREKACPENRTTFAVSKLKAAGVAVTAFKGGVDEGAPPEELKKADAEVKLRLEEVTALIERLRARKK
jgi:hypothetical protein